MSIVLPDGEHLSEVPPLDLSREAHLRRLIDRKTKPIGSLGRIETLALQLGLIQGSERPRVARPTLIVFAADHGIVEAGVSPYPQAVTAQMVGNFLNGGAAINVFSAVTDLTLEIVDVGVATPMAAHPALVSRPVAAGTHNFLYRPAMSRRQVRRALEIGAERVAHHAAQGSNTFAFGEMGIGNTSAAACLMSRYFSLPIEQCVGRGTGVDDAGLDAKRQILAEALNAHPVATDPLATLATFGGFELAAICGAVLAAARRGLTVVVDGFIATAAVVAAAALAPDVVDYCVFAHASEEAGHRRMLALLGARPLLELGLRLGEGTGAALAMPLLRAAAAMLSDMASFESAGVSDRA